MQAAWIELGTSSRSGLTRHQQAGPILICTNRVPLLDLPVDILLSIASSSGIQATARLQSTCRQLYKTLQDNRCDGLRHLSSTILILLTTQNVLSLFTRLWQSHLEQGYRFWTLSGIHYSQHACKDWKALVTAACLFDKLAMPKNILCMPQAVFDESRRLWNSGESSSLLGCSAHSACYK